MKNNTLFGFVGGALCAAIGLSSVVCCPSSAALSIENGSATNITATNAWLVGNLVGTNATNATLTCYYGAGNGGTNPVLWQYSNVYGVAVSTGLVSVAVSNLMPATWYYFSWSASDTTSSTWPAISSNFTTLATAPTSYPTAGAGRPMIADTNGNVLFPTNPIFPGITLGGVKHTTWPAHGTGDVATWSFFPATQDVDIAEHGIKFGGVTRTNWPVDASDMAASNAALAIRVGDLEVGFSNVSLVVTGLVNYSTNYATHAWLAEQGYLSSNNYAFMIPLLDARYSALGHLHSGVYSPVAHLHTGVYSPYTHLHEGVYLRAPTGITANTMTNYVAFYDGINDAGGVKTRFAAPWSGNVTNWQMVGVSTGEWIVPKLSIGPTTMLRPRLLNLFGTNQAFISQAVYGDIQLASQTNYATAQAVSVLTGDAWTTPENIVDGVYTNYGSVTFSGVDPAYSTSRVVRVSSFNFAIPENASIRGMKVKVVHQALYYSKSLWIQLWNNGYTSSVYTTGTPANPNAGLDICTNEFGANDSIWGLNSLSAVEVNAPDFSVDVWLKGNNYGAADGRILTVQAEIFYSTESFGWRSGVDSDGRYKIQCDNTGDTPVDISTNSVTLSVPLSVPQITLGTNPPITNWPAVAQSDTNQTSVANLYTPRFVGDTLVGGAGAGTNAVWISKGTTTNDWIAIKP